MITMVIHPDDLILESRPCKVGCGCFFFSYHGRGESGQIITTKPPVGHPKWWFSKGIPPKSP